jgi:AcrR family transcriptional regulator
MPAMSTVAPTRPRAAALPPDERRARIIDATLPLLLEFGSALTTRQIAQAAGVAEGTLFRVFRDKDAIISAAIVAAYDVGAIEAALDAIDATLPFEQRLVETVEVVQRRLSALFRLSAGNVLSRLPDDHPLRQPAELLGVLRLFESERDRLRCDPRAAAKLLRGLTLAATHPALNPDAPMSAAEVVDLLLDGVRARPGNEHPTC